MLKWLFSPTPRRGRPRRSPSFFQILTNSKPKRRRNSAFTW